MKEIQAATMASLRSTDPNGGSIYRRSRLFVAEEMSGGEASPPPFFQTGQFR